MWYPSQEQQQQYSWYGYIHHPSSQQQQQAYSRTSYYCNDDELSSTYVENESLVHCQPTRNGKKKAIEIFSPLKRFSYAYENQTNYLYKYYNFFHFSSFITFKKLNHRKKKKE